MKVIKPPKSILKNHKRNKLVFLAGTIEMGNSEDWQAKAENYFEDLNEYTILNPRRDNWDSSWEQDFENPVFYQQVNWELRGLDLAHKIIMYLDPNTKSPVSMLELGLYANSGKLLVCCPKGFWRKGNIDVVCEKYNIPIYESLDQLLEDHFKK